MYLAKEKTNSQTCSVFARHPVRNGDNHGGCAWKWTIIGFSLSDPVKSTRILEWFVCHVEVKSFDRKDRRKGRNGKDCSKDWFFAIAQCEMYHSVTSSSEKLRIGKIFKIMYRVTQFTRFNFFRSELSLRCKVVDWATVVTDFFILFYEI